MYSTSKLLTWLSLSLLFALLISLPVQAEKGKTVSFVIGLSLEPYFIKGGKGIIGEIISESLQSQGYSVSFQNRSNLEALKAFNNHQYDAVAVVTPEMVNAFLSKPFAQFDNRVITLADGTPAITELAQLQGLSIIGFSNARTYLGDDFEKTIKHANYREIESQLEQARALLDGEVDAIVTDTFIFEFNRKRLIRKSPMSKKYRKAIQPGYNFHRDPFYAAFHHKHAQQAFNRGYQQLLDRGRVDVILNKYRALLISY